MSKKNKILIIILYQKRARDNLKTLKSHPEIN